MKKTLYLLILFLLLIIPYNVSAKDYNVILSYFAEGGIENTGDIEVYNNLVFEKDGYNAEVTYKSTDTINYLNSLDKKTTFTLKKNNKAQVKNKEWYGKKYTDSSKVYFSNSEKYTAKDLIQKLEIDTAYYSNTGEAIEIFLYANYSNTKVKNVAVKNIELNTSSKEIKEGDTYTIKATITPSDATNKQITWKSSNKEIATVTSNGVVKGIGEGTATITATTKDGNKKATSKVKVVAGSHKVIIKYNVNGGKLASEHKKSITVKNGLIRENDSDQIQTIFYKDTLSSYGLANYSNKNNINIEKEGYIAEVGAEWNTKKDGTGKSYSQSKEYEASDFCDASKGDCTVTLYVNWKERNAVYFLESGTEASTDAILLVSGKKYGLIDTSQKGSFAAVSAQLEKLGVKELEFIQYTHMHADHVGNYPMYFNKENFIVKKLYIKVDGEKIDNIYQSKYERVIKEAKNNNIEICDVKKRGCQNVDLGLFHLKLYNTDFHEPKNLKKPSENDSEDDEAEIDDESTDQSSNKRFLKANENLNSIVTLVTIYNKKIYLAGDIGDYDVIKTKPSKSDKQEALIAKKVGKVDVYKVAHHGSKIYNGYFDEKHNKSSSISTLKPTYSIFTANKVLKSEKDDIRKKKRIPIETELKNAGSKLYYTGSGTVKVSITKGGDIKVTQKKLGWWE